jgi:hypothetical protein
MDEIDEMERQISFMEYRRPRLEIFQQPLLPSIQREEPKPIDFSTFNYSLERLQSSVKDLQYSDEHVKFVEEKLGVTREGECAEKINAMNTEEFIRFYKEVMEEWETMKRKYPERKKKKKTMKY